MRFAISVVALLALSACSSSLTALREAKPTSDHFNDALASEYLAYANSEKEQGRGSDANYYAAKGLRALKNEPVEPEKVDVPEPDKTELNNARQQLMTMLGDDMKHVAPQKLARAQLLFDCWKHQLSKRIDQEKAPCGDEFKSTFEELQRTESVFAGVERVDMIDFDEKSTAINDDDTDELHELAEEAKQAQTMIWLEGRAAKGQSVLLQRRMHAIEQTLIADGVLPSRIKLKEKTGKPVRLSNDVAPISANQVRITLEPIPVRAAKSKEHTT